MDDSSPTRSIPDLPPISVPADARGVVDLTLELDFTVGGVTVSPRSLRVLSGGPPIILQRRVMQVLVVLRESQGRTVSHEQLTSRCWGRRFVGEDAIQRCVAALRRLGDTTGGFSIETLSRVGYRLIEAEEMATAGAVPDRSPRSKVQILGLVGAFFVLAIGGLFVLGAGPPSTQAVVSVETFDVQSSDRETVLFARSLKAEIVGVLGDNQVRTLSGGRIWSELLQLPRPLAKRPPSFRLEGAVLRDGNQVAARVNLLESASGLTVWSLDARQPWARRSALREVIATATNEAVQTGREAYEQPGLELDAQTVDLFIRGSIALQKPPVLEPGAAERLLQMAVNRAPDFAAAHASLAVALYRRYAADPAADVVTGARIRGHAERAIALDTRSSGAAYDALHLLARREHPQAFAFAEAHLLRGLKADPEFPFLSMRACSFYLEVGRGEDAMRHCERALELRRLSFPVNYRAAMALYVAGNLELASNAAARAAQRAPDHERLRMARLEMAMFSGPAPAAILMLRDPRQRPQLVNDQGVDALVAVQLARMSDRPADIDRALGLIRSAVLNGALNARHLVLAATLLRRTDLAFATLNDPSLRVDYQDGLLFMPPTAALRRDLRFWPVADRLGLIRYWRAPGAWPSLCKDPQLRSACERFLTAVPNSALSGK